MNAFWWAVVAASIWGIVPLLERMGLAKVEPLVGLFYRCIGVIIGIVLLPLFLISAKEIKSVDARSAFLLITSGFLASFIAQIAFYKALKLGDVSCVVPVSGSYPFISFILGLWLLGETAQPIKIFGVILIVGGIWFLKP